MDNRYSCRSGYFNPRPPRGGRLQYLCVRIGLHQRFQSTPPARGATAASWSKLIDIKISIHAPREGGDLSGNIGLRIGIISIHAPREGGDSILKIVLGSSILFQSTPPARGATQPAETISGIVLFQSTPPARGATPGESARTGNTNYFNPRPPRGGRQLLVP